jgi:hypothetical protein
MKISKSFDLNHGEHMSNHLLQQRSPKGQKSPLTNKLTLTSELKIKQ